MAYADNEKKHNFADMKQTTINEDGKYEVIESKYLIQHPWLTARLDYPLWKYFAMQGK